MVLDNTKEVAEAFQRTKVNDVAVTVPTNLNDPQRQATKVRIINEPTAAAVTCGLDKKGDDEHNELIHDESVYTFDDYIFSNKNDIFEVKAMNMDFSFIPQVQFLFILRSISFFPFR